jgi:hypothetical protein
MHLKPYHTIPRSLALSTQTTEKDTFTETQKYPAIEENKTLRANPAFVISLKSRKTVLRENVFDELFNAVFIRFSKTDAKVQLTDRNRNEEFRFFLK